MIPAGRPPAPVSIPSARCTALRGVFPARTTTQTVCTSGVMRSVSLTARMGALSITTRSNMFEASATSFAKEGPLKSSAGFGARRPPVSTKSLPTVAAMIRDPSPSAREWSRPPAETDWTAPWRSVAPTR